MLRLGTTEQAVTELVAIGEHVVGLSVAAAGFRLDPDRIVPIDEPEGIDDPAEAALEDEIREWTREKVGLSGVPTYWLHLRPEQKFRAANWRSHQLILGDGEIDAKSKSLIAFAVASYRSSSYWLEYFERYCRVAFAVTDVELREAVLAAMHSASFNTVAHGMMLGADQTDMRAADFHGEP